jgi:hypothetical protein
MGGETEEVENRNGEEGKGERGGNDMRRKGRRVGRGEG